MHSLCITTPDSLSLTSENAKKAFRNLISRENSNQRYNHYYKLCRQIEEAKNSAQELFKNNKFEEAYAAYDQLLSFDPTNIPFIALMHANKAFVKLKMGDSMEALKDINKSIAINPTYSKAFLRRANIYKDMGNFEQARYDFNKFKELEPGNQEVDKWIKEMMKKENEAKKKDYYKILGVEKTADAAAIKKAYRKKALEWHPDKHNESEEQTQLAERMFKDINEAYTILSDPKKKEMYDSGVDPNDPNAGFNMGGGFSGGDASEIFKMFFQGGDLGGSKIVNSVVWQHGRSFFRRQSVWWPKRWSARKTKRRKWSALHIYFRLTTLANK